MSWSWEEIPITLPCPTCRRKGIIETPGRQRGCEDCRGFGQLIATMRDVRSEYRRIREMFLVERGIENADFDELVGRHVARAKKMARASRTIWFDAAFFLARDYDLLEKWWQIQEFGRKRSVTKKKL